MPRTYSMLKDGVESNPVKMEPYPVKMEPYPVKVESNPVKMEPYSVKTYIKTAPFFVIQAELKLTYLAYMAHYSSNEKPLE